MAISPPDELGLHRLHQAAAALLDPLIDPALAAQPTLQAQRLVQALGACAQAGELIGVRGLSHLVTLSVPYLQKLAEPAAWAAVRPGLDNWVGSIVAFCLGHLPASALDSLVVGVQALPGFATIPDQFVSLIRRRLALDAELIGRLADTSREQAVAAWALAADAGAQTAAAGVSGPQARRGADAPVRPADPVLLARDELDMLAQALCALTEEAADLPGADPDSAQAAPVAEREWLALHAEHLRQWTTALGYLGAAALSALMAPVLTGVDEWLERPGTMTAAERERLSWLPAALTGFVRAPGAEAARRLCQGLTDPVWPIALAAEQLELAVAAITHLALIGSRQVQALQTPIGAADLSLAIPDDAEREVVDQWLRELPPLSAQLCESVERLIRGDPDAATQAQRVAHTLKGSANTVGIRGIATLAHQLEDLLALLDRPAVPDLPGVLRLLEEGTDCLAEMCEAVVGLGAAPAGALAIGQRLAESVAALLTADAIGDALESAPETAAEPAIAVEPALGMPNDPASPVGPGPEDFVRVPAGVVDRLLELAAQSSILLAQAREQLDQLQGTRGAFRAGSDRLQDLSDELGRVVDLRSLSPDPPAAGGDPLGVLPARRDGQPLFDPLELDEYDDLHTVARRIAESGADSKLLDRQLERQAVALGDAISQLERVQSDLRETVMQSRMVLVGALASRLQRATRQAARMAQREVRLEIEGTAVAVDAQLLQSLMDPLTHLLRNAVGHGIESAAQRVRLGKPAVGQISLSFEHTGRELRVLCRDDGAGIDEAAVLARAIARGLVAPDTRLDGEQIAQLVLVPGFSIRSQATQLSGRGIGLDVVQRAIARLRGTLDIRSVPGEGLSVALRLPIAQAGQPVLVAHTPTHVLALSIRQVEHILPGADVLTDTEGAEQLVTADGILPVRRLDELLGLPRGWFEQVPGGAAAAGMPVQSRETVVLLVRSLEGRLIALIAPELSQTQRVVVRPMPAWLPALPGVEGACVLGDGSAAPVIDLAQLLAAEPGRRVLGEPPIALPGVAPPVCLVVDDSVSVRRTMEGFLRDLGFDVDAAGDGREALARVRQRVPDLAIVDLEMPQMNGLALAAALRQDARAGQIPIIMITSRASEKHRRLALDAGIDAFLTKPYTEDDLAAEIRRCLEPYPPLG